MRLSGASRYRHVVTVIRGREREVSQALARVDHIFGSSIGDLGDLRKTPGELRAVQIGALHHPDPHIRRSCLWALDHFANDESMHVFASALRDEAHFVRDIALHSIACESCKVGDVAAADIVLPLIAVLEDDPKPDLRIKALTALIRLRGCDERVAAALSRAARTNGDQQVRRCAADALQGRFVPPKKRYDRSQRRHAAMGHGTLRAD